MEFLILATLRWDIATPADKSQCNTFQTAVLLSTVAYPGILFGRGGGQQIQLRTEDRENGDLGAVAP